MYFDLGSAIAVASASLFAFDCLCSFTAEVEFVYREKFGLGTALVFLNRYSPLPVAVAYLYTNFGDASPETCSKVFKVGTWVVLLATALSELILLLRTCGLYGRTKPIIIFLGVLGLMTGAPAFYLTIRESNTWQCTREGDNQVGCVLRSSANDIAIAFGLLVFLETFICALTVYQGYKYMRGPHVRVPWIMQLYRDGLLFYICILASSVVNIVMPLVDVLAYGHMFAFPAQVLHSILCNRVLLLILRQRAITRKRLRRLDRRSPEDDPLEDENTSILSSIIYTAIMVPDFSRRHDYLSTIREEYTMEQHTKTRQERTIVEDPAYEDMDGDGHLTDRSNNQRHVSWMSDTL